MLYSPPDTRIGLVHTPRARREALLRDAALLLAASLLVAIAARIQIPGPIPATLQTWAVVLLGLALGSRRATLALLAYLLEGAAGLPVFSGPGAGPLYLAGPTAGYLVGFVLAAALVGRLAEAGWSRSVARALAAALAGHALILACGFAWLAMRIGPAPAAAAGLAPFLPGAALKSLLVILALPPARALLRRAGPTDTAP